MLCQVGTYITWTITLIWSVADNYHLKTWESIVFTCAESYNQILCELDKENDGWTHALRPVISHAHRYTYITPHINRQDTPTNSIKDGWHTHEQSMNHISLNKKGKPRWYAKSPTVQNVFQPIPGLINCAVVTGRWVMHMHSIPYLLLKTTKKQ